MSHIALYAWHLIYVWIIVKSGQFAGVSCEFNLSSPSLTLCSPCPERHLKVQSISRTTYGCDLVNFID